MEDKLTLTDKQAEALLQDDPELAEALVDWMTAIAEPDSAKPKRPT